MATPATPVAAPQATASAEGKLYLPLKRYFETKAAITLKDFDEQDRAALISFYDARMGEALWVTKAGFTPAANGLISELQAANDWGLSADDYKVPGLARIGGGEFSEDDLADAEIKLSLVAMEYARHARGDRIDAPSEQLSSYLDRKPQLIERPKLLDALVAAPDKGAYLRSLHPKHPQFERLRQKLIALRKSGGEEEFEKIPDGPKITPGKSHPHVALVRNRLKVPVPGEHNALNAIAAFAVAVEAGVPDDVAKRAIASFSGVKRRFTPTGNWNGVAIYDDYAHHPVEIAAVLKAAKKSSSGRVLAVFQPHRYSRVQSLFQDFASCFTNADSVIVTPLYTAGEQPLPGITHLTMAEGIRKTGHRQVAVVESEHELAPLVATMARPGDMVICLGAGTITDWAYALPQRLNGARQAAEDVA